MFQEVSPEQAISDIQNQILAQEDTLNIVETRKYELKKELVEVMEAIRKAEYILSKLRVTEKIKTREFWSKRNG